jgi:hypothetical protein
MGGTKILVFHYGLCCTSEQFLIRLLAGIADDHVVKSWYVTALIVDETSINSEAEFQRCEILQPPITAASLNVKRARNVCKHRSGTVVRNFYRVSLGIKII